MLKLNYWKRIKVYLLITYMVLFVINSFYPSIAIASIMAPVAVVILILAFSGIKDTNRYLSISLMILGIILLLRKNAGWETWVESLSKNAGITVLLLSLPLLKIVLSYEDFESYILNFTRKYANSNVKFYLATSFTTILIGVLIDVASVHMTYELLEKTMSRYPRRLFFEAVTRSFCTNMLWAPNTVSVAIVLQSLALPWHAIALIGILVAIMGNLLGALMVKLSYRSESISMADEDETIQEGSGRGFRDSIRIFGMVFLLIFMVILLTYTTKKSVMVIVPLLAFTFPAAMAVILKKTEIFKSRLKEYLNTSLPGLNDEMVLFTSIAFFGYALGISDIIQIIPIAIQKLGFVSPIILLSFIIFLITFLAMLGLHPVISISTIAIAFSMGGMPVTEIQLALAFVTGYFLYTMLSPFSGLALVTSNITKESSLDVSLKLNFIYGLIFTLILIAVLPVI